MTEANETEDDRLRRKHAWLRTPLTRVLLFVLAALLLFAALYYPYLETSWPARTLAAYVAFVTKLSAFTIARFDSSVQSAGTLIHGRFPLRIVLDCTALDVMALYLAAAFSLPVKLRAKLLGGVLGLAFLSLANLARIVALYFAGVFMPERFDLLHEDVLTLLMMACGCLAFATFALLARSEQAVTSTVQHEASARQP